MTSTTRVPTDQQATKSIPSTSMVPAEPAAEPVPSDALAAELNTVATKEQAERDRQREAELARERALARFD